MRHIDLQRQSEERWPTESDFVAQFQQLKESNRHDLLAELNSGERPILDQNLMRRPFSSPLVPECLLPFLITRNEPSSMTPNQRYLEAGLALAAFQEFPDAYMPARLLLRASELLGWQLAPAPSHGPGRIQSILEKFLALQESPDLSAEDFPAQ